ncbi:alpha/beta hydrolase family protein [Ruania albidiflava]|uniref:alpha/beta hydrolase family protein n=1 Tax=Ruania albidiflava TaxID=366586 RepID=UPI0003B3051B|nr:prolyl oligopeptidase family serine peptidase [Ruania albidiflava]
MSESPRAWWHHWLGAVEDPAGSWTLGETGPASTSHPSGTIRDLALHSYGSTLTARLFAPDGGSSAMVIVPFYETAVLLGEPSERTQNRPEQRRSRAQGLHLAQRGLSVLAVPWWFEQVAVANRSGRTLADRYGPAAELHRRQLSVTGLGRSISDLMLAVTAVLEEGLVSPGRLGAFGHSLGGKLSLHLAALDPRVDAAAAHEPGLGFAHSNWDDPWYLGSHVPTDRDQDELLGLVAPRPFLLLGGQDGDGEHNRNLVQRAAAWWPERTGLSVLYHDGGHPLPEHVTAAVAAWLEGQLA